MGTEGCRHKVNLIPTAIAKMLLCPTIGERIKVAIWSAGGTGRTIGLLEKNAEWGDGVGDVGRKWSMSWYALTETEKLALCAARHGELVIGKWLQRCQQHSKRIKRRLGHGQVNGLNGAHKTRVLG